MCVWLKVLCAHLLMSPLSICRYASGFKIPEDFPFEDLSRADTIDSHTPQQQLPTHKTTTLNLIKQKKRTGLLGIFSTNKVRFICTTNYNINIKPLW